MRVSNRIIPPSEHHGAIVEVRREVVLLDLRGELLELDAGEALPEVNQVVEQDAGVASGGTTCLTLLV